MPMLDPTGSEAKAATNSARTAASDRRRVGLILGSLMPPESIREAAKLAEDLGYDELWCSEDYFYTAGISAVTAALGVTREIQVGTSIVSAVVRHPAVLAMEIATITRMFPG